LLGDSWHKSHFLAEHRLRVGTKSESGKDVQGWWIYSTEGLEFAKTDLSIQCRIHFITILFSSEKILPEYMQCITNNFVDILGVNLILICKNVEKQHPFLFKRPLYPKQDVS
jgi:hypothetical protein